MRFGDLLREAGLPLPSGNFAKDIEVSGISSDSRTIKAGEVFVALRGIHCDGCSYVGEALSKGAAFVLCERPLEGENTMLVANARAALAQLLDAWYGHPTKGLRLIGITGTNGKTSTAAMLAWILQQAGHSVGLIGTVGCSLNGEAITVRKPHFLANMTTPDPAELYELLAFFKEKCTDYVVMEVTSHALALEKVSPLHFSRAIFTNLTTDHLDMHGDMEAYFAEKRKLFYVCEMAIVSTLSPYGKRLADGLDRPFLAISEQTTRAFTPNGVEGISFGLLTPQGKWMSISLPIPGRFSMENAGLAALCALSLKVPEDQVVAGLSSFPGVRGRMERICENKLGVTVFLDYAHTPDALEKLLQTVRSFAGERRVLLLFGCGGDRDRGKRREMGQIASRLADIVILTSDNSRSEEPKEILKQILRGIDKERPHLVIEDRRKAIERAVALAKNRDVLVLAGKGHEEYEIKGGQRIPFSEREIVKACFQARIDGGEDAN